MRNWSAASTSSAAVPVRAASGAIDEQAGAALPLRRHRRSRRQRAHRFPRIGGGDERCRRVLGEHGRGSSRGSTDRRPTRTRASLPCGTAPGACDGGWTVNVPPCPHRSSRRGGRPELHSSYWSPQDGQRIRRVECCAHRCFVMAEMHRRAEVEAHGAGSAQQPVGHVHRILAVRQARRRFSIVVPSTSNSQTGRPSSRRNSRRYCAPCSSGVEPTALFAAERDLPARRRDAAARRRGSASRCGRAARATPRRATRGSAASSRQRPCPTRSRRGRS